MYIYIYYIWTAEVIWYKTQLTGCSYLVLQSRHVFGGLTSFSNASLVFNSYMLSVRCLPRSRSVPTSFYRLIMMFLTNRGTPQYYSLFNQINSVAHIYIYTYMCACVLAEVWWFPNVVNPMPLTYHLGMIVTTHKNGDNRDGFSNWVYQIDMKITDI